MKIALKYSKNESIGKFIHCYYEAGIGQESYVAFPHYYIPTCIIHGARLDQNRDKLIIQQSNKMNLSWYGINIYKRPIEIQYKSSFKTFNIIFKPYGLAQFIEGKMPFESGVLLCLTSYMEKMFNQHALFLSYTFDEKIEIVEQYLLTRLHVKRHSDVIRSSVDEMKIDQEVKYKHVGLSDKTFYRAFKDVCGISPRGLANVIRLRKAMAQMSQKKKGENLADVAYALGFYDQAHFTSIFKKTTSKLPKDFFKKMTSFSEEEELIFFEFIENVR